MVNCILFYLLMLSDYTIGPLSISDYALVLLMIKSIRWSPTICIKKKERLLLIIMLVGVLLSLCLNITKSYFVFSDFITSVGKLLLYIFALFLVPHYLATCDFDYIKHLKRIMAIATMGGIFQRLIVLFFGRESWPLYSLGGHWFGLITENTMFNNQGMMRSRSFWSEPAHFAIFISLVFILLLFDKKEKLSKIFYVVYIIGMICANSVAGYGIMIAIFSIYIVKFKRRKDIIKTICTGIGFFIALILLIGMNDYLRGRLVNLLSMKDHSGVVRTVGGFHILEYLPWYGAGIGNHANFYKSLGEMSDIWFSGSGEFYNVILIAIVTIGYIGALGFVMLQYKILENDKKIFLCLMVTHFGWGKLYTTPVWVFLIVYIILNEKEYVEEKANDKCNRIGLHRSAYSTHDGISRS